MGKTVSMCIVVPLVVMYTTTPYGRKSLTLKSCIYGYKQKCVYVEITAVTLLIIYATPTLENLHY